MNVHPLDYRKGPYVKLFVYTQQIVSYDNLMTQWRSLGVSSGTNLNSFTTR